MIDIPVPVPETQIILEAYLQVLEVCLLFSPIHQRTSSLHKNAGQRELIALYASALGEGAVERYSRFLTSLELSADVADRKLALDRANEHGIDTIRVAVVTAERTIEKAFEVS